MQSGFRARPGKEKLENPDINRAQMVKIKRKKIMKIYSQKDPQWAGKQLGTCKGTTIGEAGCKISCMATFRGKDPEWVNNELTTKGGYSQGCSSTDASSAKILGLEFKGRVYTVPKEICIAETDHYSKMGFPQHFFIYNPKTKLRLDPLDLDPQWEANNYAIKSFRLFVSKVDLTPAPVKPQPAKAPDPIPVAEKIPEVVIGENAVLRQVLDQKETKIENQATQIQVSEQKIQVAKSNIEELEALLAKEFSKINWAGVWKFVGGFLKAKFNL